VSSMIVLVVAGALTFAVRSVMVQTLGGRSVPQPLTRMFAAAVPAGLAAVIIVGLVTHRGDDVAARATALAVAGVVAARTKRVPLVVAIGMATLWTLWALGV